MRAITAVIRRRAAAWRGRCTCWYYGGGPYGYDAGWVTRGCPRHGTRPGPEACASWAGVPRGCTCSWAAGPGGWVMELCRLNCPALAAHRAGPA